MKIHNVEFIKGATRTEHYPIDDKPEILLSGRSNVGKSSFINSILNRKNLAHTSSKPGKTQTLNFFMINDKFYFVDVPGYGYAKVSKAIREEFGAIISEYLVNRANLRLVVMIVDLRHAPSKDDILMYEYLKAYDIPCLIVATKADKVSKNHLAKNEKIIRRDLKVSSLDILISYSAETMLNKETILQILEDSIAD